MDGLVYMCVCVCACVLMDGWMGGWVDEWVGVSVWVWVYGGCVCSGCVLGSGPEIPEFKPHSGNFSI